MALGDPVLNEVALLADLPAGGNKITGLAAGALAGESLRFDELGVLNGIAQLDASVLVPETQIPHTFANLVTFDAGVALKDLTAPIRLTVEDSWLAIWGGLTDHGGGLLLGGPSALMNPGALTLQTPDVGGAAVGRLLLAGMAASVDATWGFCVHKGLKLGNAMDANAMKITGLAAPTGDGEAVSLGDAVLSGSEAAVVADDNVIGGIPLIHRILVAGGANADTDVTLTHKSRVIDAWMVLKGAGTAGSKITVKNVANAISDVVDISAGADKEMFRIGEIDDAQHEIGAGTVLRISHESTGGDCPAVEVYVMVIRVA